MAREDANWRQALRPPQAKAVRLQVRLQRVGSRPGCLARAKCAFCVERCKIAVKSLFRKGVRERTFLRSHPKARAFARAGHAGKLTKFRRYLASERASEMGSATGRRRQDCYRCSATVGSASRTLLRTFSTLGNMKNRFLATTLPSTSTVNSPYRPSTTSTSPTPGSFRRAAAKLAARSRVEPQTGHCRIVTFFIGVAPFHPTAEFLNLPNISGSMPNVVR